MPAEPQWSNYPLAWSQAPFGRYFFNTTLISIATVLGVLFTSVLAAYAFSRMEFFGKRVIFLIFLSTLMIPFEILLIPDFVIITRLKWANTYAALIIPWTASAFQIFLLRQFFSTIPKDLYDAAVLDGAGHLEFLRLIVVPLSTPGLVTVAALCLPGILEVAALAVGRDEDRDDAHDRGRYGQLCLGGRNANPALDGCSRVHHFSPCCAILPWTEAVHPGHCDIRAERIEAARKTEGGDCPPRYRQDRGSCVTFARRESSRHGGVVPPFSTEAGHRPGVRSRRIFT